MDVVLLVGGHNWFAYSTIESLLEKKRKKKKKKKSTTKDRYSMIYHLLILAR
jgi:hypothetical protein